jgi:hypothetical protein
MPEWVFSLNQNLFQRIVVLFEAIAFSLRNFVTVNTKFHEV